MNFFDKHPVLYPWPQILRRGGLNLAIKTREVWWWNWVNRMGLRKGDRVLEIGCGRGIFLDRLRSGIALKTYGVDTAAGAIKDAKKLSIYEHQLFIASAEKLPFKNDFFDAVLSFDTLEHVKDQDRAISEIGRVLKPGGKLLLYTINSRQRLTWNWWLDKLGVDVFRNVDHDPKLFIDPDWLCARLIKNGVGEVKLDYFNSFFTLIVDELMVLTYLLIGRFFGWEKTSEFVRMFLRLETASLKLITPLLQVLDRPWILLKKSNGLLAYGRKDG